MKTNLLWAAAAVATLGACTPEGEPAMAPDHLGLITQTEQSISGTATLEGIALSYSVEQQSATHYTVDARFGDSHLEAALDYSELALELDGHEAMLSDQEKDALLRLSEELYVHLNQGQGNVTLAEASLVRMLGYWSQAPRGYTYGQRSVVSDLPNKGDAQLRNEGITCIQKGTYVTAEYDDSRGNHAESVRVGSKARSGYGCMGRCGGDCGNWWIPSSWTKDCMDHDQCSNVNYSSGGSSDANCGDEFDQAADDWSFGVWAGCSG